MNDPMKVKHSLTCSKGINIYDQEIGATSIKKPMFEQGTSEKAGSQPGEIG